MSFTCTQKYIVEHLHWFITYSVGVINSFWATQVGWKDALDAPWGLVGQETYHVIVERPVRLI